MSALPGAGAFRWVERPSTGDKSPVVVTFVLPGERAALLRSATMSPRPAGHPSQFPVSLGVKLIEALTIALLALMALLVALK